MFGSGIIDVAIGIILVYLFLSLICSVITEWISRKLGIEGKESGRGNPEPSQRPGGGWTFSEAF